MKKKIGEGIRRAKFKIKDFIFGAVAGIILCIIIGAIIYIPLYKERFEKTCVAGEEKINFDVKNVHLSLRDDFASGVPVYDGDYCKKKFANKYGKEAFSCVLSGIKTHSRVNPMVVEVGCICEE